MAEDTSAPILRQAQVPQVPHCPLVDRLLTLVEECQQQAGIDLVVQVMVGQHPSPALVVDVTTGQPVETAAYCRLDLPTRDQSWLR